MAPVATSANTGANADDDTQRKILDAAHAIFTEKGTAGARMREIAERAGVNQALLHYYFRTKERLASAVFVRAARQFIPQVLGTLGSDATLEEKVRAVVDLELRTLAETPYLPGYILSELTHHPDRAEQLVEAVLGERPSRVGPAVFRVLDEQIQDAVARGEIRPIRAVDFVVNLISLCIFPFAAKPMLFALLGLDEARFAKLIEARRTSIPEFFHNALKP